MTKNKNMHVCVECKTEIPVFQLYLCEKCFQQMLDQKLDGVKS